MKNAGPFPGHWLKSSRPAPLESIITQGTETPPNSTRISNTGGKPFPMIRVSMALKP